jgi:hypothetical protein
VDVRARGQRHWGGRAVDMRCLRVREGCMRLGLLVLCVGDAACHVMSCRVTMGGNVDGWVSDSSLGLLAGFAGYLPVTACPFN